AVIVTGDIGERESAWDEAKKILSGLKPKTFYVPGNHDVTANKPQSLAAWRGDFGNDYYEAHVKNVTIIALDGQLMGNYDKFNQKKASPLNSTADSDRMLSWLANEGGRDTAESLKAGGGSERMRQADEGNG